ncbi:hypothetical protein [Mesoflavibacter sp. CH_XMU1404-2]|uniref:hypothetical protein n=1 Tax=Mesoflavibacter sp. CH_XMU1404-2 TaxID=3107766 RepID=UPI00300998FF
MSKNHLIFFIYLITSFCFSQNVDSLNIKQEKGQIILFGESHFVKEKYDEMKHVIQQKLNNIPPKEKVTMFFELPTSLNYAINKLQKKTTQLYLSTGLTMYTSRKTRNLPFSGKITKISFYG